MMLMAYADNEAQTRRRRVYQTHWEFQIGQAVHAANMEAIVLSRQRTARGRELYSLWIATGARGRPYRTFDKEILIPKNY